MSQDTVFISVMSRDRVGLVAAIAGCLFDLGGDLSDTTFAVLGGGAELRLRDSRRPGAGSD